MKMAIGKTRWGWNQADGVWFFFEANRPPQELCPLKPPRQSLFCPHRTPQNEDPLPYKPPKIYWTRDKVKFNQKYDVRHSRIRFYGASTLRDMEDMARESNYVPIIVSSVKVTSLWKAFEMQLDWFVEVFERSVVLELVDEFVTISPSWEELKNLDELGLERC